MSTCILDTAGSIANNSSKLALKRKDSKDSCYSEEMTEDLSVTLVDDSNRLSPLALAPISRKSSACDSAYMEFEGEGTLSRDNSFRRDVDGSGLHMVVTSDNNNSVNVLDKLTMLEDKLKLMESQLKQEISQRILLETKVAKLEQENDKLAVLRSRAVSQLQSFSEKFFATPEPKYISPVGTPPLVHSPSSQLQSPRHSQIELRRLGAKSNTLNRLSSGQNLSPVLKSRYSNISL